MKQYPSIPNCKGQQFEGLGSVDVFDKLDGNNVRFEWSKKRGWYKAGSRTQMVDETDPRFGPAIRFFNENIGEWIPTCFRRTPAKLVVFGEWYGPNSFAGHHVDPLEDMRLVIFDCCVDNRGWLDPKEFLKTFEGQIPIPAYLGRHNWTRGFIESVFNHEVTGVTMEGVVGKTIKGSELKMGKAKTKEWYDRVYSLYDEATAARLANS